MKKRLLTIAMFTVLGIPFLASCGSETPSVTPSTTPEPAVDVLDAAFRTIRFETKPQKALCLGAGALRLYSYVGDMDKLIAVEDYDKPEDGKKLRAYQHAYKEKLSALPSCGIGGSGKPSYNKELLATLNPDVIFTCDSSPATEIDKLQESLHTPVVVLNYGKNHVFNLQDQDNMFRVSLKAIADAMGTNARHDALTSYIDEKAGALFNNTKDIVASNRKSVYFAGVGKKGAAGLQCSQKNHPVLVGCNAKNILDDLEFPITGKNEISEEFLATINPDVVLIDGAGVGDVVSQIKDEKTTTYNLWDAIHGDPKAIYTCLPDRDYNIQTECSLINSYFAASVAFCGEDAQPFDANALGKEVFEKFYGVDCYSSYVEGIGFTDILFNTSAY